MRLSELQEQLRKVLDQIVLCSDEVRIELLRTRAEKITIKLADEISKQYKTP